MRSLAAMLANPTRADVTGMPHGVDRKIGPATFAITESFETDAAIDNQTATAADIGRGNVHGTEKLTIPMDQLSLRMVQNTGGLQAVRQELVALLRCPESEPPEAGSP